MGRQSALRVSGRGGFLDPPSPPVSPWETSLFGSGEEEMHRNRGVDATHFRCASRSLTVPPVGQGGGQIAGVDRGRATSMHALLSFPGRFP